MTESLDYASMLPQVQDILHKYRIVSPQPQPDGSTVVGWTQTDVQSKEGSKDGRPLGRGPILDPAVIDRFLAVDKTPTKEWLDWMLFHAGGGKVGQKRSEDLIQKSKNLYFEERVKGFTEKESGIYYPPRPRAEVERVWKTKIEAKFIADLSVGDQDLASPPRAIFGFYRHWPGRGRIYERVALAVQTFMKLQAKAKQMNAVMKKEEQTDKMVSFRPKDYPSVEALEAVNKAILRFHDSKKARDDFRIATVYDDDFLTVIVPLTYAAAVRYGKDAWTWANKQGFENALAGNGGTATNAWSNATGRNESVFVYINFKIPMPPRVVYANNEFRRHELDSLALIIPVAQLSNFNEDTIKLYDTENRSNLTLSAIRQQIEEEPRRVYDPEQEENPIHTGAPVFKDEQQAKEVLAHLEAALDAVKHWGGSFDPRSVVSNFLPNS